MACLSVACSVRHGALLTHVNVPTMLCCSLAHASCTLAQIDRRSARAPAALSALRPPPPFDQTSGKVGSQDDWPARVELAVHRRSAPRPTAAQRAWHVRTSAFWPQQLRPPLEGPHTYAVGGNVGDPAARIVMADLCDVHPFVRTRARRLARCTTCRSARVQTRAKDKIAPVLIRVA